MILLWFMIAQSNMIFWNDQQSYFLTKSLKYFTQYLLEDFQWCLTHLYLWMKRDKLYQFFRHLLQEWKNQFILFSFHQLLYLWTLSFLNLMVQHQCILYIHELLHSKQCSQNFFHISTILLINSQLMILLWELAWNSNLIILFHN